MPLRPTAPVPLHLVRHRVREGRPDPPRPEQRPPPVSPAPLREALLRSSRQPGLGGLGEHGATAAAGSQHVICRTAPGQQGRTVQRGPEVLVGAQPAFSARGTSTSSTPHSQASSRSGTRTGRPQPRRQAARAFQPPPASQPASQASQDAAAWRESPEEAAEKGPCFPAEEGAP